MIDMKFVDKLLSSLMGGFNFIGDMIYKLITWISKPLTYLFYFLDGIFYFFYQLALIVWKVISIFVALIQFFVSIVAGFFRFIGAMLTIDFSKTPVNYPSASGRGISIVLEVIEPIGLLKVVPLILIAVTWFFFIKKIIGLIGGTRDA